MQKITFTGNCQLVSLCYFLQKLLDNKDYFIQYIVYGEEFKYCFGEWSQKCNNIITEYEDNYIKELQSSDIIIYQEVKEEKSLFANEIIINKLKKDNCLLIKLPVIYFDYSNYDNSYIELTNREERNNVTIKASEIIKQHYPNKIMLNNNNHPSTFFFLEMLKRICQILQINFFDEDTYNYFMQDQNHMELPGE